MDAQQTPWEDHLLERKTDRDLKDIRRTAVAFANSVLPEHTAVILIGEGNDGVVSGVANPDEQQRKLRAELDKIYPPIVWRQKLYEKDGKTCIRLEIEYSGETPHFGDAAWIRHGSETIKASEMLFQKLIIIRTSKARELEKWLGKQVTVTWIKEGDFQGVPKLNRVYAEVKLAVLTEFFATFETLEGALRKSEPLQALTLSWDDTKDRLRIFVSPI